MSITPPRTPHNPAASKGTRGWQWPGSHPTGARRASVSPLALADDATPVQIYEVVPSMQFQSRPPEGSPVPRTAGSAPRAANLASSPRVLSGLGTTVSGHQKCSLPGRRGGLPWRSRQRSLVRTGAPPAGRPGGGPHPRLLGKGAFPSSL